MNFRLFPFAHICVCSLFLFSAMSYAGEPSLTWKVPETVAPGAKYSVSVSCVDAATVVLLRDGMVVASGQMTATAKMTERSGKPVVFTAAAYGGSLKDELVDSRTVSVEAKQRFGEVVDGDATRPQTQDSASAANE